MLYTSGDFVRKIDIGISNGKKDTNGADAKHNTNRIQYIIGWDLSFGRW